MHAFGIPMAQVDAVAKIHQPRLQAFGDEHGSVAPARATDSDRKIALALVRVARQKPSKHRGKAFKEWPVIVIGGDVIGNLRFPARVVAQIGGLARGAAVALPFDSEPTGFTSYLELLAARFNSHG